MSDVAQETQFPTLVPTSVTAALYEHEASSKVSSGQCDTADCTLLLYCIPVWRVREAASPNRDRVKASAPVTWRRRPKSGGRPRHLQLRSPLTRQRGEAQAFLASAAFRSYSATSSLKTVPAMIGMLSSSAALAA